MLGTPPGPGRLVAERDDQPDAASVAVVSDVFWRARLGARPDFVGQSIVISGRAITVVGIAPPSFGGLELSELGERAGNRLAFWLPRAAARGRAARPPTRRGTQWCSDFPTARRASRPRPS